MSNVVDTVEVRAGTNSKQLFGPQNEPVMVQNQGTSPVTLSNALTTSQSISLAGGQSLTWPADTPCFASTIDAATIAIGVGATAGPVSTVDVASIAGSVDVTGSTVDLASGATVNLASGTSVDVSGTVDLASGTTVDVSSISGDVTVTGTVNLASGTTVDVGAISGTTTITGTVDLASGTSVDIGTVSGAVSLAAGTAAIGTVALASGSTVTLDAGTATIGTVDVNGPVALASGTSVAISGTPTVDATGSTVGLASGTTVDASGSTVSLASGTTVDLASGTSVEISSGTVTLAAGTADIGTVAVSGPVALASNTAVSINGTATVDATGSTVGLAAGTESIGTVGLASGTTVNVGTISGTVELAAGTAVIGTVDLASGSTVTLDASTATIGTVDLASGSTVELAAGTAVIGTVDLASGASVDITSGTVDIGTVSGNVGVVNGSGALFARTLPTESDILITSNTGGATTLSTNKYSVLVDGKPSYAGQLTISNYKLPYTDPSSNYPFVSGTLTTVSNGLETSIQGPLNTSLGPVNLLPSTIGSDATSFENGSTSNYGGWVAGNTNSALEALYIDHAGSSIMPTNTHPLHGNWVLNPYAAVGAGDVFATSPAVDVTPGTMYTAYCPIYGYETASPISARVGIVWLDSSGSEISQINSSYITPTGIWEPAIISGPAPSSSAKAQLQVKFSAAAKYDGILLDMVGFVEGSTPPQHAGIFTLSWIYDGTHVPSVTLDLTLTPEAMYKGTSTGSTTSTTTITGMSSWETFGKTSTTSFSNTLLSGYQAGSTTQTSTSLTSNISAENVTLVWNAVDIGSSRTVSSVENTTAGNNTSGYVQFAAPAGSTDKVITTTANTSWAIHGIDARGVVIAIPQ